MTDADARGRPARDALVRRGRLLKRVTVAAAVACFAAFAGLAAARSGGAEGAAATQTAQAQPAGGFGDDGEWSWGDPASGGAGSQLGSTYSTAPPVARSHGS